MKFIWIFISFILLEIFVEKTEGYGRVKGRWRTKRILKNLATNGDGNRQKRQTIDPNARYVFDPSTQTFVATPTQNGGLQTGQNFQPQNPQPVPIPTTSFSNLNPAPVQSGSNVPQQVPFGSQNSVPSARAGQSSGPGFFSPNPSDVAAWQSLGAMQGIPGTGDSGFGIPGLGKLPGTSVQGVNALSPVLTRGLPWNPSSADLATAVARFNAPDPISASEIAKQLPAAAWLNPDTASALATPRLQAPINPNEPLAMLAAQQQRLTLTPQQQALLQAQQQNTANIEQARQQGTLIQPPPPSSGLGSFGIPIPAQSIGQSAGPVTTDGSAVAGGGGVGNGAAGGGGGGSAVGILANEIRNNPTLSQRVASLGATPEQAAQVAINNPQLASSLSGISQDQIQQAISQANGAGRKRRRRQTLSRPPIADRGQDDAAQLQAFQLAQQPDLSQGSSVNLGQPQPSLFQPQPSVLQPQPSVLQPQLGPAPPPGPVQPLTNDQLASLIRSNPSFSTQAAQLGQTPESAATLIKSNPLLVQSFLNSNPQVSNQIAQQYGVAPSQVPQLLAGTPNPAAPQGGWPGRQPISNLPALPTNGPPWGVTQPPPTILPTPTPNIPTATFANPITFATPIPVSQVAQRPISATDLSQGQPTIDQLSVQQIADIIRSNSTYSALAAKNNLTPEQAAALVKQNPQLAQKLLATDQPPPQSLQSLSQADLAQIIRSNPQYMQQVTASGLTPEQAAANFKQDPALAQRFFSGQSGPLQSSVGEMPEQRTLAFNRPTGPPPAPTPSPNSIQVPPSQNSQNFQPNLSGNQIFVGGSGGSPNGVNPDELAALIAKAKSGQPLK